MPQFDTPPVLPANAPIGVRTVEFANWKIVPREASSVASKGAISLKRYEISIAIAVIFLMVVLLSVCLDHRTVKPGDSIAERLTWIAFPVELTVVNLLIVAARRKKGDQTPFQTLKPLKSDEAVNLLDLPFNDDQFPVSISVYRGSLGKSKLVGEDQGAVTFSGEILHFDGLATAFDLPAGLLLTPDSLSYRHLMLGRPIASTKPDGESLLLTWRDGHSEGKLYLRFMADVRGLPIDAMRQFHQALHRWVTTPHDSIEKLTLPPVDRRF